MDNCHPEFGMSLSSNILVVVPVPIIIFPLISALYVPFLKLDPPTISVLRDDKLLFTISTLQTLILHTVIVPKTFKLDDIFTLPFISNVVIGLEVPIPTFPLTIIPFTGAVFTDAYVPIAHDPITSNLFTGVFVEPIITP